MAFSILKTIWNFAKLIRAKYMPGKCCKLKYESRKKQAASWSRFFIEGAFEFYICVLVVFYPREGITIYDSEERVTLDYFAIWYTVVLCLVSAIFLFFVIYVTCKYSRKTVFINRKLAEVIRKDQLDRISRQKTLTLKRAISIKQGKIDHESSSSSSSSDSSSDNKKLGKSKHRLAILMLKKIKDKQEDKLGFVKDLFEDLNPISLGA